MLNLTEVGVTATAVKPGSVDASFGVYLPDIHARDGFEVIVRVIHKNDRFDPTVKTLDRPLTEVGGSVENLWRGDITIPTQAGTNFGLPGTYLYRFQLVRNDPATGGKRIVTRWFTDPFARATDVGELSAFTAAAQPATFTFTDGNWRVPEIDDLVVYELHVEEFNSTFDGVVERLPYLRSLGVNCLELMPITSLKLDFDWGYGPLHYFAPNERWGGVSGLKRLVDACHAQGVAVILDVVYQHVSPIFPYYQVYADARITSPMIAGFGPFGPEIDYAKDFARQYVQVANAYWLNEYHIDGFRYDEVTDLYDGPIGVKYPRIAFEDYNASFKHARFTPSGKAEAGEYSRIIQCPEAFNRPQEILRQTYSNTTWQNALLDKSEDMARHGYVDDSFMHILDTRFSGYPDTKTVRDAAGTAVDRPVAPFQYLESHDHSQLIAFVGVESGDVAFGDRSRFYKLQPFAIALYTSQGVPMLWQGQEFAENWVLPDSGNGRICFRRDLNWEYFYDDFGAPLVRLYRVLGHLRRTVAALRSRDSFYYNVDSRPADGVVAYRRQDASIDQVAMVLLNFSDQPRSLRVPFPQAGTYREMIDDGERPAPWTVVVGAANEVHDVEIPSNYGWIFVR
jgi:maltooligosyltrehalose trehalohydrolase